MNGQKEHKEQGLRGEVEAICDGKVEMLLLVEFCRAIPDSAEAFLAVNRGQF